MIKAKFRKKLEKGDITSKDMLGSGSIFTPTVFWYYIMASRGIVIQGYRNPMLVIPPSSFCKRGLDHMRKAFVNELEYPHDVLLELSDLGAAFFDPELFKRRTIIITHDDIKRKGFIILSIPVIRRWFRGQKVVYELWQKGKPLPTGAIVIHNMPNSLVIKMDQIRRKIRLEGPNTQFGTHGAWWKFVEYNIVSKG